MTLSRSDFQTEVFPRWVAIVGQVLTYSTVPASIIGWEPFPSLHLILIPIYIVALFGLVAAFRGATFSPRVQTIAWLLGISYAALFLVEIINGDLLSGPKPADAHFFITYLVLLAFPFFVLGMRACSATIVMFERTMMACIAVATAWSLWEFFFVGVDRPGGFNGLNTIAFSMVLSLWALLLATRAFRGFSVDLMRLGFALLALVPIVLSGTRLVWICAVVGSLLAFLQWVIAWRRWQALPIAAGVAMLCALLSYQLPQVQDRLSSMNDELGGIATAVTSGGVLSQVPNPAGGDSAEPLSTAESGDPSDDNVLVAPGSIGWRYAALVSGLRAFLERPLLGYGLADAKIAALNHRPDNVADFSQLWHLHNQYVTHMVAFGIAGLAFLVSILMLFPYAGFVTNGAGLRRYSVVVAVFFGIFMLGGIVFARSMLYGFMFQLLGIILLAEPASAARQSKTPVPATERSAA